MPHEGGTPGARTAPPTAASAAPLPAVTLPAPPHTACPALVDVCGLLGSRFGANKALFCVSHKGATSRSAKRPPHGCPRGTPSGSDPIRTAPRRWSGSRGRLRPARRSIRRHFGSRRGYHTKVTPLGARRAPPTAAATAPLPAVAPSAPPRSASRHLALPRAATTVSFAAPCVTAQQISRRLDQRPSGVD